MANANMLELINIEICMLDDMQKQLNNINDKYIDIHKSLEKNGNSELGKFTLEDIMITNDEIKKKLLQLIAARDGVHEKIVEELKIIRENNK